MTIKVCLNANEIIYGVHGGYNRNSPTDFFGVLTLYNFSYCEWQVQFVHLYQIEVDQWHYHIFSHLQYSSLYLITFIMRIATAPSMHERCP